jgi:hypothetical protein
VTVHCALPASSAIIVLTAYYSISPTDQLSTLSASIGALDLHHCTGKDTGVSSSNAKDDMAAALAAASNEHKYVSVGISLSIL